MNASRPVVLGVDALLALVRERALYLDDDLPDGEVLEGCSYGWRVVTFESNTRVDLTLRTVHQTPEQAFLEATDVRAAVLACGFSEYARNEVMAVRTEDDDHAFVGWRGRLELGLRAVGDPRGLAEQRGTGAVVLARPRPPRSAA